MNPYKKVAPESKKFRLKAGLNNIIHRREKLNIKDSKKIRIKAILNDGSDTKYCYLNKVTFPISQKQKNLSFKITSSSSKRSTSSNSLYIPSAPNISLLIQETPKYPTNLIVKTEEVYN